MAIDIARNSMGYRPRKAIFLVIPELSELVET
jgi:hypothetical protein